MLGGCNEEILQPANEDFNVKTFISNIKSYNVNADYDESTIPADTASTDKPYVSVQSWVIKGKDILMSITVPDDAEELYFGAVNSQADYMGLNFSGPDQNTATGYYRLQLSNISNTDIGSNKLKNYLVVLSSNEEIQLNSFDLMVSYKTAKGISNITCVPVDVITIAPYQKNLKVGFRPLTGYTYTIKISTPDGGQITYSYNNDTGKETFNNSQSSNSSLSYDSGLDLKWIDFSDPKFGGYTLKATIEIDFSGGSQYIFLLLAIMTEGKIDQIDLDADIQLTGQNKAVGTVDLGFSYFDEYQFIAIIDPIIKDGYHRIPINVSHTINVQVFPNPLPPNEFITLQLITDPGTFGAAVFDVNGTETQSLQITSSQLVTIKGKKHSSKKENLLLSAIYKGSTLTSQRFSVRTWPINFHQVNGYNIGNGILRFEYYWDSESNNYDDIKGLIIGEIVEYSGDCKITGNTFMPDSPPYNGDILKHPNIKEWPITGIGFPDEHAFLVDTDFLKAFKTPYKKNVIIGEQYYRFRDPVIMDPGKYEYFLPPHYIRRNVYEDPENSGIWKYRIEKDGITAERVLPKQ